MKRLLPFLIVLAAAGILTSSALAQDSLRQGGYDVSTRKLEAGFKIVSTQRVFADNECYPGADEIAAELRKGMHIPVVVAPSLDSVQGFELVNVVSGETACNRLVLAIRAGAKGRVFVLDSDYGPVYVQGGQGLSEASLASGVGALRDLTAAAGTAALHRADSKARFAVNCPDGTSPLGGGWVNTTPVGSDGSGLYSHSYERLGVQGGFHVTAVFIDRSRPTTTRHAQIQVLCGDGLVPTASPHATTFVRRHASGTVTARCPSGTRLFSGGFQRTNFSTPDFKTNGIYYGGNYITESRAVGNGWRVSAGATGANGGELTAIAYCADDPSLPITTVSSTEHVTEGEAGSATTPRCPRGRALIAGGFSSGGSHDALIANGYFTRARTWAATGYGWFGSADVTAYGYCAKVRDTVDRSDFPKEPPPPADDSGGGGHTALYVVGGALVLLLLALFLRRRQVVRRRRPARG
jgi:MYXO-CTERM domain-containing protein